MPPESSGAMQRLRNILSVTAVRLSIAYTLVFGIIAILIIVYMTAMTTSYVRLQIKTSIDQEIVQLAAAYETGGINGVMRTMESNATAPGANLYVVADPTGQIVAGNVREIDTGVIETDGWTLRPFEYARFGAPENGRHLAIARIVKLPNGMRMLIGRDLGEPERFRVIVTRALAFSLAAMLLVGLLTWILIGRRALTRLEMVSQSSERILSGDRTERLPVTGSGDEFDRLSTRLNTMLDRINMLDEGLRQVSDNIAHDLKTPLARLRNKAEAALADEGGDKRAVMQEIIADTDQIIRTFNALLMISRVESGSVAGELSLQDLSSIVEDVSELYQPVAEEGGFEFSIHAEAGVEVRGNRELLSQALSNLIDNAIKYGRSESVPPRIDVRLHTQDAKAVVEISDTGPGIAPEDRNKVTESFTRLEQSRTRPGNGLGLSLVRAVAQLHGGVLDFGSNEPCGLRARLILPLA
jgi:signal transduction histidine kinase